MMGDWSNHDGQDPASITAEAARTVADAWAVANRPGTTVGAGAPTPVSCTAGLSRAGFLPGKEPTRTTPSSRHIAAMSTKRL